MKNFKLECKRCIVILYFLNAHKIKLIDNCKNWWKLWSIRLYLLIAIAPDLYNGISAMGWLEEAPKGIIWTIRILSVIGIFSRLIKQNNTGVKDGNTDNNKTIS